MKRLFISAMMLAMLLTVAAPAVAQTTGKPSDEHYKAPGNATDGEYYDVHENGTILYEGDVGIPCRTVLQHFNKNLYSTQQMAEACTEAGFPPKGTRASDMVTLQTPLPDTGGPPLLPMVIVMLLSGTFLARILKTKTG